MSALLYALMVPTMTKRDKLVRKFLAEPPEIDFEDVSQLLNMFDYVQRKGGKSSHKVFVGPGGDQITVPTVSGKKVKRVYIQLINRKLDLEDYLEK